jgi:hypothetical protein
MDRATAEMVSDLMLDIGAKLNESVTIVQQTSTEAEFEWYRKAIARLMGDMLLDVMNPIYIQYPELKPLELE